MRENIYFLEKFRRKNIVHGFSGKRLGNMSPTRGSQAWENIEKFLDKLGLKKKDLVLMQQVHENKVLAVGNSEKGRILPGIDGMVTKEKGTILGVKIADCLPILFYDPNLEIIGIAHAGWKGVLAGIVPSVLEKMGKVGAKAKNILVGIGPHIGGCCYTVFPDRFEIFQRKFGNLPGMIFQENKQLHLDLVIPVVKQLESKGIKKENMEAMLTCTSCQNNLFFSFRKEGKINGEMLGVISLIN